MPAALLKNFSKETKTSLKEVERLWKKAKEIVSDEYPEIPEDDNRHWALVTGILKKMLGIRENKTRASGGFKNYFMKTEPSFGGSLIKEYSNISQREIIGYSKINDIILSKGSNGSYVGKIGNRTVFTYVRESSNMYSEFSPVEFLKGKISRLI